MASYCGAPYLLFLGLVILVYGLTPQRLRWGVLLAASYLFSWSISGRLVLWLLLTTLTVYLLGLRLSVVLERQRAEAKSVPRAQRKAVKAKYLPRLRALAAAGILSQLAILLTLKYAAFFCKNANALLALLQSPVELPVPAFVLPIGISFYTLQALSYLIDVYRGTVQADRHFGRLALWLSFFPGLMQGPISRYGDTAAQLWQGAGLEYGRLTSGLQRIGWGLAKKIVLADRVNLPIKELFSNYESYDGGMMFLAMVLFTVQEYMEFSGTMDVVIGSAEIFGVRLPENFRQPFAARSISEFWTRWHITLGAWFKDYIFYPVAVSGRMKELTTRARKRLGNHFGPLAASAVALFCVWLANGLWHGDAWNYIFFGMYHFALILSASLFEPLFQAIFQRTALDRQSAPWRAFQAARTALLVCVGELFFRAHGLRAGLAMFARMVSGFTLASFADGTFLSLGMDGQDYAVLLLGILAVAAVGRLHGRGLRVREGLAARPLAVRWACYYLLILIIVIFGAYGANYEPVDPIYAAF